MANTTVRCGDKPTRRNLGTTLQTICFAVFLLFKKGFTSQWMYFRFYWTVIFLVGVGTLNKLYFNFSFWMLHFLWGIFACLISLALLFFKWSSISTMLVASPFFVMLIKSEGAKNHVSLSRVNWSWITSVNACKGGEGFRQLS